MAAPKKILVEFETPPVLPCYPVTGAWGGLSPGGDVVVARVYVEQQRPPTKVELGVNDDGSTVELARMGEATEEGTRIYIRKVQCELVMSPMAARSFGKWLIERANMILPEESKK